MATNFDFFFHQLTAANPPVHRNWLTYFHAPVFHPTAAEQSSVCVKNWLNNKELIAHVGKKYTVLNSPSFSSHTNRKFFPALLPSVTIVRRSLPFCLESSKQFQKSLNWDANK